MKLRELTDEEIRRIYAERLPGDFAPDEIKPLSRIEREMAAGRYACYGYFGEDGIAAYAFFIINERYAMVDYLAVREDLRGQGTGSRFIRAMMEELMQQYAFVLLETEDPSFAADEEDKRIRERRLRFYQHNGLTETGVTSTVWNVDYRVLALPVGTVPAPDEVRKIYTGMYRNMLTKELFDENVNVHGARSWDRRAAFGFI